MSTLGMRKCLCYLAVFMMYALPLDSNLDLPSELFFYILSALAELGCTKTLRMNGTKIESDYSILLLRVGLE